MSLSLLSPGQAGADPETKASITATLAEIAHENEQLTEQYLAAKLDVEAKTEASTAAQSAAEAAQATFEQARALFKDSLIEQYTGSSFSRTAALLNSDSGQEYLDQLEALNLINVKRSSEITELATAKSAADAARATAADLLSQATQLRDSLSAQREELDAEQAEYTQKLNALDAAERAAYFAAQSAAVTPTGQTIAAPPTTEPVAAAAAPAPSDAAAIAVQTALAQQGKPYVYASGGPSSFDCSGLTSYAWAAAGVYLPHNAAAQYGYGTRVSIDSLQPGDLVFYYSPIGHVGLYIGNGQIVHAPTSGDVVRVASVYASGTPIGATRL